MMYAKMKGFYLHKTIARRARRKFQFNIYDTTILQQDKSKNL